MSTLKTTNLQNASAASPAFVLAADGSATANLSSVNGGPIAGTRNRIINGDMRIDQRNAGASVTPSNQYTFDRWYYGNSQASKGTIQQNAGAVTPPSGFDNYMGFTSSSAYSLLSTDEFFIRQPIEGFNFSDLAFGTAFAKSCTISFWVRSSLTGTFGGAVKNSAQNRSYPFTYTISTANTWENKTITIAGDTTGTWIGGTNGIGAYLVFGLGVGSTRADTGGAWAGVDANSATGATSVVATNGATFYITGVQLEPGSTATPFERRSYGQELALCQRYYYTHARGYGFSWGVGTYYAGNLIATHIYFPVSMRSAPALDYVTGTDYYGAYGNGAFDAFDAMGIARPQQNGTAIDTSTGTSGTAGQGCVLTTNNSNSFIAFTAEL
jgi:hypothetical protein